MSEEMGLKALLNSVEKYYFDSATNSMVPESVNGPTKSVKGDWVKLSDLSRLQQTSQVIDIEAWQAVKKLTDSLNYIKGIVERGIGHPLKDSVTIEDAVLNYVKHLESKNSEEYNNEQN